MGGRDPGDGRLGGRGYGGGGYGGPAPGTTALWPTVEGYEIMGRLGAGGMGAVYRARRASDGRPVALKLIRFVWASDPDRLARFRAEAEAVARLAHRNILHIHAAGVSRGRAFMALELMEGGSLDQKIRRTPQPIDASVRLMCTLAQAMDHAHRRGIVHRDLKPANILLSAEGTPKIGDFGLVRQLPAALDYGMTIAVHIPRGETPGRDDESDPVAYLPRLTLEDGTMPPPPADWTAVHTRAGTVLGTPSYMAAEQAEGLVDEIGPPTDVYALGAILYELLTGRPPFRGSTALETVRLVLKGEPDPVDRIRPEVGATLAAICSRCLQKAPGLRYADGGALAEDLERFLAGARIREGREPAPVPAGWAADVLDDSTAPLGTTVAPRTWLGATLSWAGSVLRRSVSHRP